MHVIIATDVSVLKFNNKFYLYEAFGSILFRYYQSFGKVTLICREKNINNTRNLIDITNYVDNIISVKHLLDIFKNSFTEELKKNIKEESMVVVRCPSIMSIKLFEFAKTKKMKIYAENMCDAWDSYWTHSFVGKFIAPIMYLWTKRIFAHADYALYVTNEYLQKRYPCNCKAISASNVKINDNSKEVLDQRINKIMEMNLFQVTFMTTANVDNKSKGQEYVISAISKLKEKGIEVIYYLVGGGNTTYLKHYAEKKGVNNNIVFLGQLTHTEVLSWLDKIDFYIQPSLQEGLPRAVIEAMSRGCPCFGAKTAGIPELINEACVFKRRSSNDIVTIILNNLNKKNLCNLAKENFNKAKEYTENILGKRRELFYQEIINENCKKTD